MTSASDGRSLLARTLLRILPAVIAVQLVIGWLASVVIDDMVSQELERRLTLESKQYARVLAVKAEALLDTARSLAGNDLIVNAIVDAQERDFYIPTLFASLRVPGPPGAEVALTDYKGRLIATNHGDRGYEDAAFTAAVLSGNPWRNLSEEGFTAAAPVMMAGVAEGMIVINIGPAELPDFLRMPSEAGPIAVTSRQGAILYSSDEGLTARLAGGADERSGDWVIVSSDVPWFGNLQLLTGRSKSEAFAVVDRLSYFLWADILVSVAAVALAIFVAVYMTARPMHRFIDSIEAITRTGRLDQAIAPEGAAEFHRLAGAFNRMLATLRSTTASRDELQQMNEALDRANVQLEESETRYHLAVNGSAVGIWDWDARTNSLFWSDRLKKLVGVSSETFTSDLQAFERRLHPEDCERVMQRRRQHLANESDYDVECRLRKDDSSYIWLHIRGPGGLERRR